MSISAKCDSCGKQYKVSEAGKKYRCKACGGTVAAAGNIKAATPRPEDMEGITCSKCNAFHPSPDARFCNECGQPLQEEDQKYKTQKKRLALKDKASQELASKKIKTALRLMGFVRIFYILGAIVYGGLFLIALMAAFTAQHKENVFLIFVSTVVLGIIFTFLTLAAWKIYVYPFMLSLVMASISTVSLALMFMSVEMNPILIINIIMAIFLWITVIAALNMRKLLNKLEGIYVSEHGKLCRKQDGDHGKVSRRMAERNKAESRKHKTIFVLAGVAAITVIFIVFMVLQFSKPALPDPINETALRFTKVWNQKSDMAEATSDIAEFFSEDSVLKMSRRLEKRFKKYKWENRRPLIEILRIGDISGTYCEVSYSLTGSRTIEPMGTSWKYLNDEWMLRGIQFPRNL